LLKHGGRSVELIKSLEKWCALRASSAKFLIFMFSEFRKRGSIGMYETKAKRALSVRGIKFERSVAQ
jgi:hypothetical protein